MYQQFNIGIITKSGISSILITAVTRLQAVRIAHKHGYITTE